ncbi:MAG: PAS domain S-box protein [Prolixibacteraceae bacterium]
MKRLKKRMWLGLVSSIIVMIIGSWVVIKKIEEQNKKDISGYLAVVLGTAQQGFHTWTERHYANTKIWANETLPLARELLKVARTQKDLLASPAQTKLRALLKPFYAGHDFEGFFIIGPGNLNLASSRNQNVGIINLLSSQGDVLQRMWSGETVMSLPLYSDVPLPDKNGRMQKRRATMFVGTPIKDETGKIIAIFTLRIDPNKEFSGIFARARIGNSGETYCVDRQGRMISTSRFHKQLAGLGIIRPDETELLNLTLTTPGVNLPSGKKTLTTMAASLTAGESGTDLEGHPDYRGVPVIGTWVWDKDYGIGITTQIDKAEAYQTFNFIRSIGAFFSFLSIIIIAALTAFFYRGRKQLSESEVRFRSLYENSVMGLYRTTPAGEILLANPTLVKMLGFDSVEELKKRDLEDVSYVNYAKRIEFKKLLEEKDELTAFQSEWYRKDGSVLAVSENTKAVKDKFGNVMYYDGTVEDITRRKQAEEELQLSKKFIEDIINTIPVRVFWKDKDLIYRGCNQAFAKDAGFSDPQDIIGKDDFQMGWSDQAGLYQRDDKHVIEYGCEKLSVEEPQKTPKGDIITLLTSKIPLRDSSGEIDGVLGVYMDITEMKRSEAARIDSELRMRLATEAAEIGIWEWNVATNELKWDAQMFKLYGISPSDDGFIDYSNWRGSVLPEDLPQQEAVLQDMVQGRFDQNTREFKIRRSSDGSVRIIQAIETVRNRENGLADWIIGINRDITESRLAEENLKESELKFRSIIESSPVPYALNDEFENIIYLNNAFIKTFGYSLEDIPTLADWWPKAYPDSEYRQWVATIWQEHIVKAQMDNIPFEAIELDICCKNGTKRTVIVSAEPLGESYKQVHMVIFYDITGRKFAEEEMKKLGEQYELIKTTELFGYWLLDEKGKIIDVNDTYCRISGFTREELLKLSIPDIEVNDKQEDVARRIQEIIKNGIGQFEGKHRKKDGSAIDVEISVAYWPSQQRFISFIRDITERRQAEEEIRKLNENLEFRVKERTLELQQANESLNREITEREQAEKEIQKLSQAVEQAPAVVIITDKNGNIEYTNPVFSKVTGYLFEEVKGENPRILKSGNHPKSFYDEIWATINSGKVWKGDILNKKKNGELYWESSSISPIHSQNGEITHYVAVKTDITLRKKMEKELIQAKTDAEMANQAKSEFLSRMSHELRTPMNSILGFAQLMDMGELKPAHKKGIDHILKSGKHLLDLINEVLDISKIEAGHISLSLEPIAICPLVSEMLDVVSPLATEKQITLDAVSLNNLFVKADRQRLKQVLLNLVSNAIKYNRPNGFVKISCELTAPEKIHDSAVRVSISDSGKGISPDDMINIFTPFERIGAEKTATEGTGLGLAVAKKLIEAMNGTIGIESEVGHGSTFWVELPKAESQIDRHDRLNQTKPETEKNAGSGTILYIEDNISNIQLVDQILEAHRPGFHLITDMNGKNTVKLATDFAPDIILLDLDLPDIHGSEVLRLLQGEPKTASIPVIVLSADAMEKQKKKLMKAGAKRYLTKPIDVVEFLRVVDEMMK